MIITIGRDDDSKKYIFAIKRGFSRSEREEIVDGHIKSFPSWGALTAKKDGIIISGATRRSSSVVVVTAGGHEYKREQTKKTTMQFLLRQLGLLPKATDTARRCQEEDLNGTNPSKFSLKKFNLNHIILLRLVPFKKTTTFYGALSTAATAISSIVLIVLSLTLINLVNRLDQQLPGVYDNLGVYADPIQVARDKVQQNYMT